MPPKKKQNEPGKKTVEKKKEKIIEDKTFGLKNKKGKKQQTFVKQVTQQVKYGGNPSARKLLQEQEKKKLEKTKGETDEVTSTLFKPVITQKVSAGADPRSVLCAFFKQGQCGKGDKCKFSHDLNMERKGEKRSLYVDQRDAEDDLKNDTMDKWDQQKLEEVIEKKHGAKEKTMPKTEIVCKYFLEAVEKNLYGWFWSCPNGGKCIYRHALPPGYVLKKKQEKEDSEKDEISIEELIETERTRLGTNLTRVTLETFLAWKQRKIKEKKDTYEKEQAQKKDAFKSGRIIGKVSGRDVFTFRPELVDEDDDEVTEDFSIYRKKEEDEDGVEVSIETMALAAREADGTGTAAAGKSFSRLQSENNSTEDTNSNQNPDTSTTDVNGLEEACGGTLEQEPAPDEAPPIVDGIPIEESLFDEDLDVELDDLEIVD